MEFGIHLPLIGFLGAKYTRSKLVEYTEHARDLGYISHSGERSPGVPETLV